MLGPNAQTNLSLRERFDRAANCDAKADLLASNVHVIYNEVDHRSILIHSMLVAPLSHMTSTEEMIRALP